MTRSLCDPFGTRTVLVDGVNPVFYYRLSALEEAGLGSVSCLPFSVKVLLEAVLRQVDGYTITEQDLRRLAAWSPADESPAELPFKPARVLLQDFTGVPAIADLAAMRAALARLGGSPRLVNPQIPVDLVIDHSVQVDLAGSADALAFNARREFERNSERYQFVKWGQCAFDNFRVVPPATGIIHQVNLEYLATVVRLQSTDDGLIAFPDSLVGTDSHTTMINGLGVLGWGVGGIEAEAVMLGQPISLLSPRVVGVKLTGRLPEGATATDLVLTVVQVLRAKGVVDKFVEFFGPGLDQLSLPDRATLANMAPEYGATMGFFPIDDETLRYLSSTGRDPELVRLVGVYAKAQGLFRSADTPDPIFSDVVTLDLRSIEPSIAGPKRPQDRIALRAAGRAFAEALTAPLGKSGFGLSPERITSSSPASLNGVEFELKHGSVVIAAITSCTNTSNPSVMLAAGVLARNAVRRGMRTMPWVKTSLAPGSQVVKRYLDAAGLTPHLEQLGFYTVGYGCTTCIGNSGPLPDPVAEAILEGHLIAAAVLSGNRNFEGRIHPLVQANYLASPPLVVAYALAGRVDIDFENEPLGTDGDARPVFLRDLWPAADEVRSLIASTQQADLYHAAYGDVFAGNPMWNAVAVSDAETYQWGTDSTYIQEPPFFSDLNLEVAPPGDIRGARALLFLGDSVTTDHISPAGPISADSPAGRYLLDRGVPHSEFNAYGTRRGNHEVLMRGTFANGRIKNRLLPGIEGGLTEHLPSGQQMSVYDAAMRYLDERTPLLVIAGKEYGTGSSRDWAAKGPSLLGVRAVIAQSFERIHRSNLVGMGILPLEFLPGESPESYGLTGRETFTITGITGADLQPRQKLTVVAVDGSQMKRSFTVLARVDTPVEVEYYRNGGVLQTVLRRMATVRSQP